MIATIFISLCAVFFDVLFFKLKLWQKLMGVSGFQKMVDCEFCRSFWCCVLVVLFACLAESIAWEYFWLIAPATSLKLLINKNL